MMKFSSLLITTLMLGLFMLSSGLVCLLRGLELYQKEEAHNAILRFVFGCVFLVFGPVVIAVEQSLRRSRSSCKRDKRSRKRPGPRLSQRSQNAPPPRLRRRRV
ncbi:uncharacterized protein LOC110377409 isoform X1 [Helicoverpa armigera]|uniref:uncharacterized protein LOC124632912 n=1 Tax=Helicoverpa zea TaxID=7113 RepID=UPI000B3A26DC|nr:uncharacterized protein LOC110377409 isoform X1 [Helicoverpa armigera]XP_047023878.1 uncharacterized protein LOC124632912 [Helicoverpa zea]